jgi:hypothetical protein
MNKKQEPTVQITVKVKEPLLKDLQKVARKSGVSLAELVRGYIDKGMGIDAAKADIDFVRQQIREELSAQLKPAVERIVKLTIKSGIASAAGYFLNASALSEFISPARQREYEEVLAESKKLGVYYFRLPSSEVEEFLKEAGSTGRKTN